MGMLIHRQGNASKQNRRPLVAPPLVETLPPAPEKEEGEEKVMTEIERLRITADELGITYHPNIGEEKLRARIAEVIAEQGNAEVSNEDT